MKTIITRITTCYVHSGSLMSGSLIHTSAFFAKGQTNIVLLITQVIIIKIYCAEIDKVLICNQPNDNNIIRFVVFFLLKVKQMYEHSGIMFTNFQQFNNVRGRQFISNQKFPSLHIIIMCYIIMYKLGDNKLFYFRQNRPKV